jgi:hypothetical protein
MDSPTPAKSKGSQMKILKYVAIPLLLIGFSFGQLFGPVFLDCAEQVHKQTGGDTGCDFSGDSFDYINCYMDAFPVSTALQRKDISISTDVDCIPIFILFSERVSSLFEAIRSFHKYIKTCFNIIIFDDDSQYTEAVSALHWLDRTNSFRVTVHYSKEKWNGFGELFEYFKSFIESYLQNLDTDVFVISDPDCALDSSPGNILLIYREILLNNLTGYYLRGVGASIRWDDWPMQSANLSYEANFRLMKAQTLTIGDRNFYYLDAKVDTTFVMYRKMDEFQRLARPTIRMLPPLGVRHLDFYLSRDRLSKDYEIYLSRAERSKVNHMIHLNSNSSKPQKVRYV